MIFFFFLILFWMFACKFSHLPLQFLETWSVLDSGVWRAIQLIKCLYVHYSELLRLFGTYLSCKAFMSDRVTIFFLSWPDLGSEGWRTRSIRSGEGLSFGRLVWSMPVNYVWLLRFVRESGFQLMHFCVVFKNTLTDLSVRLIRNKFLCSLPNIVENELRDPSDVTQ